LDALQKQELLLTGESYRIFVSSVKSKFTGY